MSKRRNWLFCIVMGLAAFLMTLLPDPVIRPAGQVPRCQVRVRSVNNSAMDPVGLVYTGVQACEVEITQGPYRGRVMMAQNYLNGALDSDKVFEAGDLAIAMVHERGEGLAGTLVDHDRRAMEGLLLGLYALLLIVFGGVSGVGSLVSMAATGVVIWKVYLPLMIRDSPGHDCPGLVMALTVMIDLLVAGPNRMALSAMIGSLGGTAVTIVLALILSGSSA